MRVHVLGPLTFLAHERPVPAPAGRVGELFRRLLVVPGEVVDGDALIDALWPGDDRRAARRRLEVVVSRLRRFLHDHADEAGSLGVERAGAGYRLVASPTTAIDRVEFEAMGARALEERSAELVAQALELWGGEPYTGFALSPELQVERRQLLALRRDLVDAKLDLIDGEGPTPASRRAKFRRPVLATTGLLPRAHLLDSAPDTTDGGVLAVTAPAGFGKSVFLSLWVQRQTAPVTWVSVDDADNDPARFWAGVVGALVEGGHRDLDAVLSSPLPPGSPAFLAALCDSMGRSAHPLALALDDLHLLTNPVVLDQLETFLAALPPHATIGLASRSPIGFVDRVRRGPDGVRRIRADQLRFNRGEVAALADDPAVAERLWDLSEGWPVAVTALRSAGPHADAAAVVGELSADLIDEVLANAPSAVERALMTVAHLAQFSIALCEHVAPDEDAAGAVAWLRGHQLIAQAGASGTWFQLHQLFLPALRRRAEADPSIDPGEVQRRAAEWFLREGLAEDALRYAVACGDRGGIAAAAPQVLLETALREEFLVCTQWLAAIDPEYLAHDLRAHSIATCLASLWSRPDVRRRWAASRRRSFGGDDDVVLSFQDGTAALHEGRASESVACFEHVVADAESYAAAEAPDLGLVLTGLARSKLIEARMFQDTLRSDDEVFADVMSRMRSLAPAVATYTLPFWSLTAFAEGDNRLAADLAQQYFDGRRLHDPGRPATPENSLPGALAAAQRTVDDGERRRLAEGIEDLTEWYSNLGMSTSVVLTHLVAAALYRAGNDPGAAHAHQRHAHVLLTTMPDVPFLERFASVVDEIIACQRPNGRGLLGLLTDRERELLSWLATDASIDEIARSLHLNRGTVSNRVSAIYQKLNVHNRHSALLKVGIENLDPARLHR